MISVVICSIHRNRFNRTVDQYRGLLKDEPHEMIGIHDARSIAEGYNRGLAQSRGEIVIFSHDDLDIWTAEFIPRLKKHLETVDVVGVAGTNRLVGPAWYQAGPPHIFGQVTHASQGQYQVHIYGAPRRLVIGIQAMDGLLLAFRREAIEKIGWDAERFDDFHCYDIDTTFRAHRAGLKLAVALDLPVYHHSLGNYGEVWKRYAERFMQKHGEALTPMTPRKYQHTCVQVAMESEARELMQAVIENL